MATAQTPIVASNTSIQVLATSAFRRSLFIQNYAESAVSMYIAFGQSATAGTNGELEIAPGQNFSWGGILAKPSNPPSTGTGPAPPARQSQSM